MKTLEIQLPDRIAAEISKLVEGGWFLNEAAVAQEALSEFLRHFQPRMQEQFQREDIGWALALRRSGT